MEKSNLELQSPKHRHGKMIDLDTAFDRIGGYGRFQKVMTILLAIWKNSGQWGYYCFAYLVLSQRYLCRYEKTLVLEFETDDISDITSYFFSPSIET